MQSTHFRARETTLNASARDAPFAEGDAAGAASETETGARGDVPRRRRTHAERASRSSSPRAERGPRRTRSTADRRGERRSWPQARRRRPGASRRSSRPERRAHRRAVCRSPRGCEVVCRRPARSGIRRDGRPTRPGSARPRGSRTWVVIHRGRPATVLAPVACLDVRALREARRRAAAASWARPSLPRTLLRRPAKARAVSTSVARTEVDPMTMEGLTHGIVPVTSLPRRAPRPRGDARAHRLKVECARSRAAWNGHRCLDLASPGRATSVLSRSRLERRFRQRSRSEGAAPAPPDDSCGPMPSARAEMRCARSASLHLVARP